MNRVLAIGYKIVFREGVDNGTVRLTSYQAGKLVIGDSFSKATCGPDKSAIKAFKEIKNENLIFKGMMFPARLRPLIQTESC